MAILLVPDVTLYPASYPRAVLKEELELLSAWYPIATVFAPVVLDLKAQKPKTVFEEILHEPRPRVIPLMERFPSRALILSLSVLLVRITRSIASVVQRKFVDARVQELPRIHQSANAPLAAESDCQLPIPLASETSTFPFPGFPPAIRICQLISTFAPAIGATVPKPIRLFVESIYIFPA